MSHNYLDWADLNEEGKKEWGHIFTDGVVPILSMIPIMFESPNLTTPEKGYLVRGSDLTEDQVGKIVEKISQKFNEPNKDEIMKYVQSNELPIREKMTCGIGTKRIHMYLADDDLDEEEDYENDEWEDENGWDDEENGWSIEDDWQAQEIAKSRVTSERRTG